MNPALALAALVALSGCAITTIHDPADWTKPNATYQQISFDDMECERASREILGTLDLVVGGVVDIPRIFVENGQREHIYTRCMNDRGYDKVAHKQS